MIHFNIRSHLCLYLFPVAPTLESVGLPGQGISPSQGRYLHKHRINADIRVLSGIRTHGPSVRGSEDGLCLRSRGHFDRLIYCNNLIPFHVRYTPRHFILPRWSSLILLQQISFPNLNQHFFSSNMARQHSRRYPRRIAGSDYLVWFSVILPSPTKQISENFLKIRHHLFFPYLLHL
jgi:hypothetical protein